MIYLDSNVFVYAAINNGPIGEKCRSLLMNIAEGEKEAGTSVITWDEVVHAIWKKEGKEKATEEGDLFLQLPNVNLFSTNQLIISKAQRIMKTSSLKPRDSIHIATALANGCTEIVSDDSDFDKIKEIKVRKIT